MEINWQQVKEVFAGALLLKPENRSEYIHEQCAGNKWVAEEVESLLSSYDDAAFFLESPAVSEVAEAILEERLELDAGKFLKHYQIVRKIGTGGMGEVYLAHDKKLDRKVAVKILNRPFGGDQLNLKRFLREAKVASGLNHPNIMVVHEIGVSENIHYIVCEYVEGDLLDEFVERNNSSIIEILDFSIQISSALAVAHKIGIIHRDIKPDNIMVREDGIIKILDFGLAKPARKRQAEIDLNAQTQDILNTRKGIILGTVAYMSPEQARGKEVDARTDIWSLGVILFQLITGKLPFSGETTSDALAAILRTKPPSLEKYASNIPPELKKIVRKALRKDSTKRYQTALELSDDLKNLRRKLKLDSSEHRKEDERPERVKTDFNLTAITARQSGNFENRSASLSVSRFIGFLTLERVLYSLILTAILAVFGYFVLSSLTPAPVSPKVPRNLKFTKLTDERIALPQLAVSPDGKFLAYVFETTNKQSLRIRQIAGNGVSEIVAPAEVNFTGIRFSPDSEYLFYTVIDPSNKSALYKIPILGGSARLITERIDGQTAEFSPDGKNLVYVQDGTSIIVADIERQTQRVFSKTSKDEFLYSLAWHPNGQTIVGAVRSSESKSSYLVNFSYKTAARSKIESPPWEYIYKLAWLADGSGIIINGTAPNSQSLQIWFLSYPDGKVSRITNDTNDYFGLSLTADGRSLVTGKMESIVNLWITGEEYKKPGRKITFSNGRNEGALGAAWAGQDKIVYTVKSSQEADIWSADKNGSNRRQLTFNQSSDILPDATGDGKFIFYVSETGGRRDIWRMNADGTSPVQLTKTPETESFPAVTSDGKWIVHQRIDSADNVNVWKVKFDGSESVQLTKNITKRPAVSPDGRFFACVYKRDEKSPLRLAVYSTGGGEPLKILDLPRVVRSRVFRWTADGTGLIYVDDLNDTDNLWIQPLDAAAPPKQLTEFDSESIVYFDVSKNKPEILIARGEKFFDAVMIGNLR